MIGIPPRRRLRHTHVQRPLRHSREGNGNVQFVVANVFQIDLVGDGALRQKRAMEQQRKQEKPKRFHNRVTF